MKHLFICQPLKEDGGFLGNIGAGKETMDTALKWAQNHVSVTPGCSRVAIFKFEGTLERDPAPSSFKKAE